MGLRQQRANAIRLLSLDAVQKANSGHPGMPMGMADIAEVVWHEFLRHNPADPRWVNRDRFVLSNGHGSMLLYSLLHLTGYDFSLDELKNFRQLHAKSAGHPERHLSAAIETTTGPLGQGIANAVGMALAEKLLAQEFNRPKFNIVDHYIYCFLGDGCLMEGISHESCSLAGTWGLGKLIAFWDDNNISIDGEVSPWFSTDTAKRFQAYGWHVIKNIDGHNADAIERAVLEAQQVTDQPSLICCKTTIGFGSPNFAGTEKCHGSPLGNDEIALVRKQLNWNAAPFEISDELYQSWSAVAEGEHYQQEWQTLFAAYQQQYPELATEFQRRMQNQLPATWPIFIEKLVAKFNIEANTTATRKASLHCIEQIAEQLPELLGGSADLSGSNCTQWSKSKSLIDIKKTANYIHYGVREFGMSAIMNGMVLHGGYKVFGGTFLVFSDYARNAVRMAALMQLPVTFVFTHDSIGLGEDGPTHQPIEHAASLRLIPNLNVWRPCDEVETLVAWQVAIENQSTPNALLLTRQNLPYQHREESVLKNIKRGGYILKDCQDKPDIILIATGSEVQLAVEAAKQCADKNIRVVSMPCVDLFLQQEQQYQQQVLPQEITKRIAIEAGVTNYWYQFVGLHGKVIGIDRFGESAPAEQLFDLFGLTVNKVIETINELEKTQ
jgi:transketolase